MKNPFHKTEDLLDAMIAWRHDFHMHPEIGCLEHRTSEKIADLLRKLDLEVHTGIGGTGVVAVLRRGSNANSIALRADMDALAIHETNEFDYRSTHDGLMHACGHDGHMAMLLGAAHYLAAAGEIDGTVYFIFQPGEEPGKGAKAMLADGLFEKFPADSVFAMHNMPSLPVGSFAVRPGPVMASEDHFEITILGKGTHAALPHQGVDPIMIGSEIVIALQSVVSRVLNPVENAVVSVTEFLTDGTCNVLPGKVTLKGDTRSFLPSVQARIETSMERIVRGLCAAHGAGCDFSYSHEFVPTINSPAEARLATEAACAVAGEAQVNLDQPPFMASEDFGYMLNQKPGCYLFIGNGGQAQVACGLHNPGYDFNDMNLTVGADFWVRLVESQLSVNT